MLIPVPPRWAPNAVPKKNGWFNPVTGEHLVSKRFSEAELDNFYNLGEGSAAVEVIEEPETVEVKSENKMDLFSDLEGFETPPDPIAPWIISRRNVEKPFDEMTKKELKSIAKAMKFVISGRTSIAEMRERVEEKYNELSE